MASRDAPAQAAPCEAQAPSQRRKWGLKVFAVGLVLLASVGAVARAWRRIQADSQFALVRDDLRQFHPEDALNRLNALAARDSRSAETEFLLACACRRVGRLADVSAHLKRASELGWDQGQIDRQYCLTYFQAGDFRRSGTELLDRLHERASDDEAEEAYEALARGYTAAMLLRQADFILESWLAWRPQCLRAHLMRAEVAALAGSATREMACYEGALRCDSTNFQARRSLAPLLIEANEIDRAAELFGACLRDRPNDAQSLVGLAECEQRRGRPREAQRFIDRALAAEPDRRQRSAAFALAGQIALAAKDYERACQMLRQAVEFDPANVGAVYSLSQALIRADRQEESKAYLARWQRLKLLEDSLYDLHTELLKQPEDADLRTEIGEALLDLGAGNAGATLLISALLYEPDNALAHQRLADYYQAEGQADLAELHRAAIHDSKKGAAEPAQAW